MQETQPIIGFIGLGLMGSAMVQRLLDQGYKLNVIANRNRTGIDAAVERGATEHKTAKALSEASDIVMLCMDTSISVEGRMLGNDGVIAGLAAGKLVIDFGTSLPASTLKMNEALKPIGAGYIDAPLGRTPSHGREGKLNIMAAGTAADYDRAKPLLDDLGENVFHVGPAGSGHTLKLINNFFAMTTACAMSEAFAMADKAGLSRETLYEVMAAGPLRSGMMDFVKGHAIDDEILLAFSVANAGKDLGYYGDMADALGVESIMSTSAQTSLGHAKADGWGDRMVPELVDYFAEKFKA